MSIHDCKSQEISPASTACKIWSECESSISVDSIDIGNSNRTEKNFNDENAEDETKHAGFWDNDVRSSSKRGTRNLNSHREKSKGGEILSRSGSTTPVRCWSALSPEAMRSYSERRTSLSPKMKVSETQNGIDASGGVGSFQHLRQCDYEFDRSKAEIQGSCNPSDFQQGSSVQLSEKVGFSSRGQRSDPSCVPTTSFPDLASSIKSAEIRSVNSLRAENVQELGAVSSSKVSDVSQNATSNVYHIHGKSDHSKQSSFSVKMVVPNHSGHRIIDADVSVHSGIISKNKIEQNTSNFSLGQSCGLDDLNAHQKGRNEDIEFAPVQSSIQNDCNFEPGSSSTQYECNEAEFVAVLGALTRCSGNLNSKADEIQLKPVVSLNDPTASVFNLRHINDGLSLPPTVGSPFDDSARSFPNEAIQQQAPTTKHVILEAIEEVPVTVTGKHVMRENSNLNSENLSIPIEHSIPDHSSGAKDEMISVATEVCDKSNLLTGQESLSKVYEPPKTEVTAADHRRPCRADKEDRYGEALGYDREVLELKNDLSRALTHGRASICNTDVQYSKDRADRKYRPLKQDSSERIRSILDAKFQGDRFSRTGNGPKSDLYDSNAQNSREQQRESQRCKGVDIMREPARREIHPASDTDLFHGDACSLCCQNSRILLHRVSLLQSQLDVQVETSKKLATMCAVLREEHNKEMERLFKEKTINHTSSEVHLQYGLSHADCRDAVMKDSVIPAGFGTHPSGKSILTYRNAPEAECERLREKLGLLQAQHSKDSIRAIKAKECLRLREVINMLQTKLSLEVARAVKAEKHLEKVKERIKHKADTGGEQVCVHNSADQNDSLTSLRDEVSKQKSIIQKLRTQNTLLEQQNTERHLTAEKIKELEKRLGLYEAEILCIQTKNAHLEEILNQLKENNAKSDKEAYRNEKVDADSLKCALKQCEKALSEKVAEVFQEKSDADALKCALEQCEKALSEKVAEVSKEKAEVDALKCALKQCEKSLAEKVSELSKEKSDADALKCALKQCEKALTERVSELSKEKVEVDALKCALEQCEKALSGKVAELSEEKVDADALKCALMLCEKSLSERVAELSTEKVAADALKIALKQCEKSLAEKVSELSKLQSALNDHTEKNKMLYCDLQNTVHSHQLLQNSLHLIRADEASLLVKMKALEEDDCSKSYKLDQITQENRILQNRLESTQVQYEELERALQDLYARHLPNLDQDHDQTSSKRKDIEETIEARESTAISRAKALEKEIESHRLAFENCKCELEMLRDFRTTAIQEQHEREKKHSQEVGVLLMRVEEESARAKTYVSEIAQLSSECCALRERVAETLRQHTQDFAGLKQNQILQVEKIKQDLIDCTNVMPSSTAELEHIFSERHKISVQLLRQKAESYELELADNLRKMEQATLSMKESAELIENLRAEIKARNAAVEETKEKNSSLDMQLQSALQSLERAEIMIHELEGSLHHSEEKKTRLEASLFDLSRTNLELTAALTESKAKLETELRRRERSVELPYFAKETRHDREIVTSAMTYGLNKGLNKAIDMNAIEPGSEKPDTSTLIELLERDPLAALRHLVLKKDTILKILMHPEFSVEKESLDRYPRNSGNNYVAIQKPKDYFLVCEECNSLRKQIAEQEDELTTIQNEGESLKRQNGRLEHEIIRLKLALERLKKEHRAVEGELFKCKSDNEILKSLQREILMEKENLIKYNSRRWSQLQGGRSDSFDGSDLVPESHADLLFRSSNAQSEHGFLKDEEMAERETNILVGLVKKLLHNRVSDEIDQ